MPTPTDMLKEYNVGDRLKAEDVNALIKAAKRINESPDGSGDADGYAARGHKHRVSLDLDGIYDVPLFSIKTTRIPPFSIVEVYEEQSDASIAAGIGNRGYTIKQYEATSTPYVPTFAVVGPYGIPAWPSSGPSAMGRGSLLYNGGWVAYENVEGDDTQINSSNISVGSVNAEKSWGPKPGSYLLTSGYNGFRPLGNNCSYKDPLTGDTILLVYAYQVPRDTRAFIWTYFNSIISTTSDAFYDGTLYNIDGKLWSHGFSGTPTKALVSGLYEFDLSFNGQPTYTDGVSTLRYDTLFIRIVRIELDSSLTDVSFVRNMNFIRIGGEGGIPNSISLSGLANMPQGTYLAVRAYVSSSTFQVNIEGQLRIRKVDSTFLKQSPS